MKVLAVIPARYASTRFPGKPLVEIKGKTMIQRVYEQVLKSTMITHAVVATDDERIYGHVSGFGGQAVMTSAAHTNGTERCAEVMQNLYNDYEIVLNIQGDEPFILPEQVDELVRCFDNPATDIATLVKQCDDPELLFNIGEVKVVFDTNDKALYFSRQPIPFLRGVPENEWAARKAHYLHVGVYGFRRNVLLEVVKLPASNLETLESLEQLRWLENGYSISVGKTDFQSIAIETPEDLTSAEKFLAAHPEFL